MTCMTRPLLASRAAALARRVKDARRWPRQLYAAGHAPFYYAHAHVGYCVVSSVGGRERTGVRCTNDRLVVGRFALPSTFNLDQTISHFFWTL